MSMAYYRATCGSIYRVRTVAASRGQHAGVWQARRTPSATDFSSKYETTTAEVAKMVGFGSFIQVPCPKNQDGEPAMLQL